MSDKIRNMALPRHMLVREKRGKSLSVTFVDPVPLKSRNTSSTFLKNSPAPNRRVISSPSKTILHPMKKYYLASYFNSRTSLEKLQVSMLWFE
ncbi:hypothetical protein TNCT_431581 [Trichonephila clavata]|uniref:Uncharacterized protein n=1 Tax=Trichonephila clavata TaxID=2740835 RepID=A0A8X6GG64_TRICU|nr:hypothetical protein TNCT_431581 [Trichonephila clavata]